MLVVLCLIAVVLPWTQVEGRKAGWADATQPGDEYLYGSIQNGGHDLGIQYTFTSRFSRICCEGLTCENNWRGCYFYDIGCGQSVNSRPIQARALRWELRDVEPEMRCFDTRGVGAFYSYTASVVPID